MFFTAFLFLHFSFMIFWRKNIGAKILMKLTPVVNFINILHADFAPIFCIQYTKPKRTREKLGEALSYKKFATGLI